MTSRAPTPFTILTGSSSQFIGIGSTTDWTKIAGSRVSFNVAVDPTLYTEAVSPESDEALWASAVIRKQLDRVVEATDRIFADAFEIEIALDELGERAGQQHRPAQFLGEGFET